jgi:hypothetical protein
VLRGKIITSNKAAKGEQKERPMVTILLLRS